MKLANWDAAVQVQTRESELDTLVGWRLDFVRDRHFGRTHLEFVQVGDRFFDRMGAVVTAAASQLPLSFQCRGRVQKPAITS
jgi:hypothetical protein